MPDYRKLVIKITKKQQIQEEKLMDYKNSGVDIEAGYKSVELMKKYVQGTMRPEVHFPWKNLKTWRNLP